MPSPVWNCRLKSQLGITTSSIGAKVGAKVGVDGVGGLVLKTTTTVGTEVGIEVARASVVTAGSGDVVVASTGGGGVGGVGGDGADDAVLSAQMPQVTGHCTVIFGM